MFGLESELFMNNYLPLFFYVTLFSYPKEKVFPFLLFASCFISFIVYSFSLLPILLTIIFYVLNRSWHLPHRLKNMYFRTFFNTTLYIGIFMLVTGKNTLVLLLSNILWNTFFSHLLFNKRNLNFSKK